MEQAVAEISAPDKGRRGPGKPTKYTPEKAAAICQSIVDGVPVTKAVPLHSIGLRTAYTWMHERPDFNRAINAAKARYFSGQAMPPEPVGY